MTSSLELTVLSCNVATLFPSVGHNWHKIEIQPKIEVHFVILTK